MTKREQIMLGVGLLVVTLFGYGMLRLRPALERLRESQARIDSSQSQLDKEVAQRPSPPREDPDELAAALELAKENTAALERDVATFERAFTRLDDRSANEELERRIADLAREQSVTIRGQRVLGNKGLPEGDETGPRLRPTEDLDKVLNDWGRPRELLELRCNFSGLTGFLHGLRDLPSRVLVLALDVDVDEEVDRRLSDDAMPNDLLMVSIVIAR
jgi:hypothetical protein